MEFFSGFSWAIPTAFADAVFQCRFEEGDVLYDSKEAYDDWGKAKEQITNSIQIRHPSKVVASLSSNEKSVLSRNWDTEVRLDLYENANKVGQGQIHTTQGRLFTLLWKGDLNVLDTNTVNPKPPVIASQLKNALKEVAKKALKIADSSLIFAMVYDSASSLLREKYKDLINQLGHQPTHLMPEKAGLKDWKKISPTIEIVLFPSKNKSREKFGEELKKVLYKPTKESTKDNFSIKRHGHIFTP